MVKRIFLIRHGETSWALNGRHTGRTDLTLTPHGCQQCIKLKERLQGEYFDKIWTSPLKRAMQTCELSGYLSEATIDPDLCEWDYGKFEGLTYEEIDRIHKNWNVFEAGAPGGESVEDVRKRVESMLEKVLSVPGDVALFSSGHFLRFFAARWLHLSSQGGSLFLIHTASISILGFDRGRPVVMIWNHIP